MQAIERPIKTAIVDKNPSVSSAALVSSYHLLPIARDLVRRWQSETQEAASSSKASGAFSLGFSTSGNQHQLQPSTHFMNQYHAIGLLYQIRSHDRMALVKMVQQYGAPGVVKSPAGVVMLVRLAAKLIEDDPSLRKPMLQLLDGWLRHKTEMVSCARILPIFRNFQEVQDLLEESGYHFGHASASLSYHAIPKSVKSCNSNSIVGQF